jgi:hypothetical protein
MSTLTVTTISNGTVSTSSANVIQGSAKAWVNFNGTGTVAIRASYNVSSITDNGTGDYTLNFTNAFADANYALVACAGEGIDSSRMPNSCARAVPTTTTARIKIQASGGADVDSTYTYVAVFR